MHIGLILLITIGSFVAYFLSYCYKKRNEIGLAWAIFVVWLLIFLLTIFNCGFGGYESTMYKPKYTWHNDTIFLVSIDVEDDLFIKVFEVTKEDFELPKQIEVQQFKNVFGKNVSFEIKYEPFLEFAK